MREAPRLDGRDLPAILSQALELRPFYTPEWTAAGGNDPGLALLEIFGRLLEGGIQRLNEVPRKSFIAFLNLLGIELLPAQPARVPLTFTLAAGARDTAVVPASSRVAANLPEGGPPVVFETARAFVATPARLVAALSVVPTADAIYDHLPELAAGVAAPLFDQVNPNLQEHALYLGDDALFDVEGPVRIELSGSTVVSVAAAGGLPPGTAGLAEGVSWQYCRGERKETVGGKTVRLPDWVPFTEVAVDTASFGALVLTKDNADPIEQLEVAGRKSRFVRGVVQPGRIALLAQAELPSLRVRVTPHAPDGVVAGVAPEAAFHNDVEIDPGKAILPFGPRPRLFDTFYLASREALSKRGATITLRVQAAAAEGEAQADGTAVLSRAAATADAAGDRTLSWEYWNGKGWGAILGLADGTVQLTQDGDVVFECPADLEPVEVLGRQSFWIRARLISGDYGKETFRVAADGTVSSQPDFHPPVLDSLRIGYAPPPAGLPAPAVVLTVNNLDVRDRTAEEVFQPFAALEDERQTFYLGFDRTLVKGPLSFFFSLEEQEYSEKERPRIEWEYFRRDPLGAGEWGRLEVVDGTADLTESGVVELFAPEDAVMTSRFGRAAFWLRAVDAEGRFEARPLSTTTMLPLSRLGLLAQPLGLFASPEPFLRALLPEPEPAGLEPCARRDPRAEALRRLPHPALAPRADRAVPPAPRLAGLFLNTTWAVQAETQRDEILGSGTGLAGQSFRTARFPVLGEELWVDELGALSDGEVASLSRRADVATRRETDAAGALARFWVRWRPVDDLSGALSGARVYAVDRTFGEVRFGDGVRGAVPPLGRDNVRITYQTGGGARGNVPASSITSLRTTIPLVDRAFNPEAAAGGADTEPLDRAFERGPETIRHGGRAVAEADFAALAREASPAVARARCLANFNDQGERETNWVTVVIVPESGEARPTPTRELRRRVEEHLRRRAAADVVFPEHVRVIGPAFVEARVAATLVPLTPDRAPEVEQEAFRRLRRFLHPLSGGPEGRGWELGRLPCLSDFFALLEGIPGLDHAEDVRMVLQPVGPKGEALGEPVEVTAERPAELEIPPYALVASGEHRFTSKLGG